MFLLILTLLIIWHFMLYIASVEKKNSPKTGISFSNASSSYVIFAPKERKSHYSGAFRYKFSNTK